MALALRDLLADPSLAASHPVVHAGAEALGRSVRWVHTSEVLDVASLLRGGELLLVGGASLAEASEDVRRTYIAELAEGGAAGLALETGTRLPLVPPEMVDEAERRGFPIIELHGVVRFVEVTQSINSGLINESVRRLQLADRVSHALAAGLAEGAELPELAAILSRVAHATVRLTRPGGEPIAEAVHPSSLGNGRHGEALTAPVTSAGVTVAILALVPTGDSDLLMLQAARERAPEALGLALLRWSPLSQLERETHEFITTLVRGARSPRRLLELADQLGIRAHTAWATVVGRVGDDPRWAAGIDSALRRAGRRAVSELTHDRYTAVVAFDRTEPLSAARQRVLRDLRDTPLPPQVRITVGPGSRDVTTLGRCLREAELSLELGGEGDRELVVDAGALAMDRFLSAVNRPAMTAEFVDEVLGDLLEHDRARGSDLFGTLAAYLRHAGHKTQTASALHLQRQTLYQRLERVMAILGHPDPSSDRWAAITVAVEVERTRRRGILPGYHPWRPTEAR
ncbi:PucR family transcriptional regulator [Pedococcus sp. NPDC057267]|uniref:PucR family transcriptional regulator n=1 Tax=Pedococcus sp. NPDC057267 TaxID=3346077 RepID=UPI003642E53C